MGDLLNTGLPFLLSAAEEGGRKFGLLSPDPGLILWTVLTFVGLLLLLRKTAWGPIVDGLDRREEKIRASLSDAGVTLLPDLAEPGDPTALAAKGLEECAAQVVVVQLDARFLGTQGDEHYAEATGNVRVLRSGTAEELSAFTVGPVKGGHYNEADALRTALGKAIDELGAEMAAHLQAP